MTDTVQTRSQLVAALASTGAKTVTAQTIRDLLISLTLALIPTGVKTANYSAGESDLLPCDATGGSFTIALPTAPQDKTVVCAKLVGTASGHTVTIAAGGSDVFNLSGGSTTLSLSLLNQGVCVQYDAVAGIWYVIGDDVPLSGIEGYVTTALGSYLPLAGGTVASLEVTGVSTLGTYTSGTLPSAVDGGLIHVSDMTCIGAGLAAQWATLPYVANGGAGTLGGNALTIPGFYGGYAAPPSDTTTPVSWLPVYDTNGTLYKVPLYQ